MFENILCPQLKVIQVGSFQEKGYEKDLSRGVGIQKSEISVSLSRVLKIEQNNWIQPADMYK